jgi:predicted dehydrogenase
MKDSSTRRSFLQRVGFGAAALGMNMTAPAAEKEEPIAGLEPAANDSTAAKGWTPASDHKIRVGIAGYGYCKFGAQFGFQDHPNVQVVAVTDLLPDRCDGLAKDCRCDKTYPSLEEMLKDDRIEAVYVATDAPGHARHCIEALKRGKHVAVAVPAVWGSLDDAHELYETVKASDRKYMMFETSCYHAELHAMREIYRAGLLGNLIYAEGEYYHYCPEPIPSYEGWRVGMPPQWYPTHSNAYHVGVTGGSFTEVSCLGMPSVVEHLQPAHNRYGNPFGTEVALFRTSEGGMARMVVSWDTPGREAEAGRIRGQRGSFDSRYRGFLEIEEKLPSLERPPLPPGVLGGHHGGSHGPLMNEFVTAILEDRQPLVDVVAALNMTVAGIVAHQSALKDGEWLDIPQFTW